MSPRMVGAFRIAAVAWLVTVYSKVHLYLTILANARAHPIDEHPLFPSVSHSSTVVTVAYWAPLAVAALIALERRWAFTAVASVFLGSTFALGWSLDAHNDATWITGFWSALWLLWLAQRLDRDDASTRLAAVGLAQAVVALCFLGGFIGKLTEAYTSGEALLHIYLERKENWPWPALRAALDEDSQRLVMVWFSRVTIVMEGLLALLPLAPPRKGAMIATAAMLGIVLVSHITLISVMACLIGLMVAAYRLAGD